ncbi:MAG: ribonuclease III [Lachnospiraceae bacterium]|nr:ribonuclease III [Lachnospiraceae bacterium]
MNKDLSALQETLSYTFKDRDLLIRALSHSSYANERKINKKGDYERLEFLGDAVVELVVSEFLFSNYPQKKEGEMTRTRAALVCEPTLAGCAREIDLPSFLLLGKGEDATGGREKDSILCDVFEAVAGAIYLDGGYEEAKAYITKYVLRDWENKALFVDSKSILQERMQKYGRKVSYVTVSESGPANERTYVEELHIDGQVFTKASAHSKKAAQQKAAYEYLKDHPE